MIHDTTTFQPIMVDLFRDLAVGGRRGSLLGNLAHISLDFDELPGGNATATWYATEFGRERGESVSTYILSGRDPEADGRLIAILYRAVSQTFHEAHTKNAIDLVGLEARPMIVSVVQARSLLTARTAAEVAEFEPVLAAAYLD